MTAFPDVAVHASEMLVDGDRGVLSITLAGTDKGGFMGLPPTGRSFRLSAVIVLTVADGQVVRYRSVYDFTGLLVQVGILKAKPA
jgi:predicted ester cyclase